MQLNAKQQYAFTEILRGNNIFISGPGGVGKSVLVRKIRDMYGDDTIFLSPTGIAAQNIQGSTIHRTFKFPLGFLSKFQRSKVADAVRDLFEGDDIKRIVIDEISMVRADLFAAVDANLRKIKRRNVAFGGLQVIVVGDFFQLPPVLNERSVEAEYFREEFDSPFAFDTDSWRDAGFQTIELDEIMRQSDQEFIAALNSIRCRDADFAKSLAKLNKIGMNRDDIADDTLFLCSTNKDADMVNADNYDSIEGEERMFYGTKKGSFRDLPVPQEMNLKIGTKVLICANDADEKYFNGQTGYVAAFGGDGTVDVQLETGTTVKVQRFTWQEFEYFNDGQGVGIRSIGEYNQLPLKLGYAVTIHKSQGLSLSNAAIYTGRGCFAHGQCYVALSRLRSLEGLHILKEIGSYEVIVDTRVKQFYEANKYANLMNA